MLFPITVDEFNDEIERCYGQVGNFINNQEEYEEARKQYVNKFPFSYTFYESNGKAIL